MATTTVLKRDLLRSTRCVLIQYLSGGTTGEVVCGMKNVLCGFIQSVDDTANAEHHVVVRNSNDGTAGTKMGSVYLAQIVNAKTYYLLVYGY